MGNIKYEDSGVNREVGDRVASNVGQMAKRTLNGDVMPSPSGYASLYRISDQEWIAASTDGVGTKLKLAFDLDIHDTVGEDLVAMSVNDLLCVGAQPLFFLDYFATGSLKEETASTVLEGVVRGCEKGGLALVGGETAEMPGLYAEGEYDLAGFAVGRLNPQDVLPRPLKGDEILVGIGSSGFHSNGFSLIRKLLDDSQADRKTRELVLTPTRIYVESLLPLLQDKKIQAMAHITGSGFLNVSRMSSQHDYEIELPSLEECPEAIQWLISLGQVTFEEACRTFNLGIGMVLAVASEDVDSVLASLKKSGERAWVLGRTIADGEGAVRVSHSEAGEVILSSKK